MKKFHITLEDTETGETTTYEGMAKFLSLREDHDLTRSISVDLNNVTFLRASRGTEQ